MSDYESSLIAPPEMERSFLEMCTESDRGCVLIGQTLVGDMLTRVLRRALSQEPHAIKHAVDGLFKGHHAPLGSFWAQIQLAYAMRLIDKFAYLQLEGLRKVRNPCAHAESPFSFLTETDTSDSQHVHVTKLFESISIDWRKVDPETNEESEANWEASEKLSRYLASRKSVNIKVNDNPPITISGKRCTFISFISVTIMELYEIEQRVTRAR